MDLHQIEIFCTLIKLRSFSKAAEALYLTQPTVSGHIKNLEQELGVKLLDRLGKQVMPTATGDILFRYGQELLALRDHAQEEISSLSGRLSGLLKIGGVQYRAPIFSHRFLGHSRNKFQPHPFISLLTIP